MRLGDGTIMCLYRQTVEDFGLYPGLELSDQQYDDLRQAAGAMSAKMRAVRIVSATSVSAKDLEQRLIRKGEDPKQAKAAVNWMEDLSLIDDRQTARQVVDSCIRKGYGLARAKQALFEKRIPREYWQEALDDYPDQSDAVTHFLRSRLGEEWSDKDLKKAIDALIRRGHSYSAVRKALENLSVDTEKLPED